MGRGNVDFLKRRYEALVPHPMFRNMEYTEDNNKLAQWIPLMMNGRNSGEPVAASKIDDGTDVNFGELTRKWHVILTSITMLVFITVMKF